MRCMPSGRRAHPDPTCEQALAQPRRRTARKQAGHLGGPLASCELVVCDLEEDGDDQNEEQQPSESDIHGVSSLSLVALTYPIRGRANTRPRIYSEDSRHWLTSQNE